MSWSITVFWRNPSQTRSFKPGVTLKQGSRVPIAMASYTNDGVFWCEEMEENVINEGILVVSLAHLDLSPEKGAVQWTRPGRDQGSQTAIGLLGGPPTPHVAEIVGGVQPFGRTNVLSCIVVGNSGDHGRKRCNRQGNKCHQEHLQICRTRNVFLVHKANDVSERIITHTHTHTHKTDLVGKTTYSLSRPLGLRNQTVRLPTEPIGLAPPIPLEQGRTQRRKSHPRCILPH